MAKKFVEEFDIELTADNTDMNDYEAFENKMEYNIGYSVCGINNSIYI